MSHYSTMTRVRRMVQGDVTRPDTAWTVAHHDKKASRLHLAIRREIEDFRHSNFARFNLDISVIPLRGVGIWDDSGEQDEIVYNFRFAVGHAPGRKMLVKQESPSSPIYVNYTRRRMTLRKYLGSLRLPDLSDVAASYQLSMQADWWQENGRSFPLLQLPRELRDLIYGMALDAVILLSNYRRPRLHSLIFVNRLVHAECKDTIARTTQLQLTDLKSISILTRQPRSVLYNIRSLRVDLHALHDKCLSMHVGHSAIYMTDFGMTDLDRTEICHFLSKKGRHLDLYMADCMDPLPPSFLKQKSFDFFTLMACARLSGVDVRLSGFVTDLQRAFFEYNMLQELQSDDTEVDKSDTEDGGVDII